MSAANQQTQILGSNTFPYKELCEKDVGRA